MPLLDAHTDDRRRSCLRAVDVSVGKSAISDPDEGIDGEMDGSEEMDNEDDTSAGESGRVLTAVGGLLSALLRHGLYL